MTRSLFIYLFVALAAITALVAPNLSLAANKDKPLMVIRFKDDSVAYEHSLDKAVKMALEAKPEVVFDVIAVTPEIFNKAKNKQNEEDAKFFIEKIVEQLKQSGVSADMIRTSQQKNKMIKNNEIQIFLQ